jgi:glyoxylase-like metal-dependent hydrolase (beta-lactamase superfamily II)
MTIVHHLIAGTLHAPPNPAAICHVLLLEDPNGLALVDTGIGLLDVREPTRRLGQPLIDLAGFQFDEARTALRQVERLGFSSVDVEQIILTHADPDHTGGLADFPTARVHISVQELANLERGHPRYVAAHFAHSPRWQSHGASADQWFGLEARPLDLGFASEVWLIPLFGHTLGHCGVAIGQGDQWLLHVGDAYYLRVETTDDNHPVSQLAAARADDNQARIASLGQIRRLLRDHPTQITLFGYHDPQEFPGINSI